MKFSGTVDRIDRAERRRRQWEWKGEGSRGSSNSGFFEFCRLRFLFALSLRRVCFLLPLSKEILFGAAIPFNFFSPGSFFFYIYILILLLLI